MSPLSFFESFQKWVRRIGSLKLAFFVFCFFFLFILLVEQPGSDESKRLKKAQFLFPKMNAGEVIKVHFDGPQNPTGLALNFEGGRWLAVNGHPFPADESRIREFLDIIQDLKKGTVASVNPERASLFGFNSSAEVHVQIWGKRQAPVADFFSGLQEGSDSFIRLNQSSEVIRVPVALNSWLSLKVDDWRNKVILSVDEKDCQRVSLSHDKEETILEKRNGSWRLISPVDAESDSLKVRSLFEELKNIRAVGFSESLEGSQVDFSEPSSKVSIRLSDGSLKIILFSSKNSDGTYFARNGEPGIVYRISQETFDRLFGLKLEIPSTPPPAPEKP